MTLTIPCCDHWQAKASGLYLDEKVDLLVRYLVVGPCLAFMQRFGRNGLLARIFATLFGHRVESITRHAAEGGSASRRILKMHGLSDITDDLGHQFAKACASLKQWGMWQN